MTRAMITVAVDDVTIEKDPTGKLRVKDDGITAAKIKDGEVGKAEIATGGVDTDELATAAVTSLKIQDGTVTWVETNALFTITPTVTTNATTWTNTANINDNDFTTYGSGTYSPPNAIRRDSVIATFDLGALSYVSGAVKASAWHSATADYDTYIYLETSRDGTTWVTEASFTVPAATVSETICYLSFEAKLIRYIRVRISMALYGEYGYSRIYEVTCK